MRHILPCAGVFAGLLLVPSPLVAQPGPPVTYVTFEGQTLTLYPWTGQKVVILTFSNTLDVPTMTALVTALDGAYGIYEEITGGDPTPWTPGTLNGLDIIAEVTDDDGIGSFLGLTGTQIAAPYFLGIYNEVLTQGEFDQAPFYELGRTFWFYGGQLEVIDAFVTGFAIADRFISMDRIPVKGGPYGSLSYAGFENSVLVDLLNNYLADPSYTWQNTLAGQSGPILNPVLNPNGWGPADLAGAMYYRIYADHGFEAYKSFWRAMAQAPAAATPQDAIANFLSVAKSVTGYDYAFLFKGVCDAPAFPAAGVVNAASQKAEGGVAPGEIVSILGSCLGPPWTGAQAAGPDPKTGSLPTTLGNVTVRFDGVAAPLLFVDASQLDVQVPFQVAGESSTTIIVQYEGASSAPVSVPVTVTSPGAFTWNYNGNQRLIAVNPDNSLNTPLHPARPDDTAAIYLTGQGMGIFPWLPNGPLAVQIGGQPASVLFASMALRGFDGILQIDVVIPNGITPGEAPIDISVGGVHAQPGLTISVK